MSAIGIQKLREMHRAAWEMGNPRELERIRKIARLKNVDLRARKASAA